MGFEYGIFFGGLLCGFSDPGKSPDFSKNADNLLFIDCFFIYTHAFPDMSGFFKKFAVEDLLRGVRPKEEFPLWYFCTDRSHALYRVLRFWAI